MNSSNELVALVTRTDLKVNKDFPLSSKDANKQLLVGAAVPCFSSGENDDAFERASLCIEAGADLINVSAGQTTTDAKPVYGRMFQTPFSDRIRNDAGLKTMAVGNIYEADHANSILMAGRADLIAVGRPHLGGWPFAGRLFHAANRLGRLRGGWPPTWRNAGLPPKSPVLVHVDQNR